MPLSRKQRNFSSISKLFNLFELDKYLKSAKSISGSKLVKLAGGLAKMSYMNNIEEEYKDSGLRFPERMHRLYGNDFIIDVYDEGNGWYLVVKVKENER